MTTSRNLLAFITVVSTILILTACAGRTKVESDLHIKGAPDWVNEGTNILKHDNDRLFHGVGMAPAMGDMSLQTSTADDRARAEVAKILTSYMQVVSRDYTAAVKGGNDQNLESSISRQIKNVSRINLTGSRIIGHWRDQKSNVIYALAEIDMNQLKTTMQKVQDMNEGFKNHLTTDGDRIFDRMLEERK
ncbi:MAG: hypothetical protein P8164_07215 [Gammaproteobacteria bacterium]|jgi:hypothetical protein